MPLTRRCKFSQTRRSTWGDRSACNPRVRDVARHPRRQKRLLQLIGDDEGPRSTGGRRWPSCGALGHTCCGACCAAARRRRRYQGASESVRSGR
jgi:hypothetical protein